MTTRALLNIDGINILLMILSAGIAYIFPFEMVLLSYAFLGPAHYLTQISWMSDRDFFTGKKWTWLPASILVLALILLGQIFVPQQIITAETFYDANTMLYGLAIGGAAAMVLTQNTMQRLAICGLVLGSFLALWGFIPDFTLGLSILLPTVVHIYIFTGAFILLGALKSQSQLGLLSFAVFIACGASFFFINPSDIMIAPAFVANNIGMFEEVGNYLADLFSFGGWIEGKAMLGFLSFAYTYHYLNWFSKAEVIHWNKIPRRRLYFIIALYLASIGLYLYDYALGLIGLLFLSLLHVILEFPLNVISFREIGKHLFQTRLAANKA